MKIVRLNSKNFKEIVNIAVKIIKKDGAVICPTDTVYGLLADATSEKAVKKVFKIKKRSFDKPLPVFIKDLKMAQVLAEISKNQEKILKRFWPGQMTVILIAQPRLRGWAKLTQNNKIGIRIPDYKLIKDLLEKIDKPLTGTSANISGKLASTKIKQVINQFKNKKIKPDLIIDAGNLPQSQASTVIDLTLKKPKVLRQGKVKI